MEYSALIVAAGQGKRMGLGYNKVFYPLKEGSTVLQKTVAIFLEDKRCKQIVVVMNQDDMSRCIMENDSGKILYVLGGERRQDSVMNGLMAVSEDYVLIHDGARPFLSKEAINQILEALKTEQACLLAVAAKDTIKEIKDGYVVKTLQRSDLVQAQTPQAFHTEFILACYKKAGDRGFIVTDDAQVVELVSDVKIKVVEGDYQNIKITTMTDVL